MKAGLLGRTLGHSLSPQIHKFFGDYEYRLYEKEPDEVAAFLQAGFAAGDFDFLNVTIPYKQTVFALCDELTPMARKLGNVNFVTRTADGRLRGDNTDAFGVERLLDSVGADVRGTKCAILGAGGAAMTVRAVLVERGASRVTFVRRGELPAQDDELIVNATPVGMFPHGDEVRVDISQYASCRHVLDLVYNPSPTRLVREALVCGKMAADGLVMLIAQAYRAACLEGLEDINLGIVAKQGTADASIPYPQRPRCVALANAAAVTTPRSETLRVRYSSALDIHSSPTLRHDPNLFLYGPPASGKSTLAKKIAAATGWTLVDLDAEIVKSEGRSIPEIFSAEGESGFRAVEKRELKRVSAGHNQVVALGGGALLDAECRAVAEAAGRVVVLDCPLATLKSRLTGGDRPLSADAARLEALISARKPHYASFPRHVTML